MWLKRQRIFIVFIFFDVTMRCVYADNVNQVSNNLDMSKSNLLKYEFPNNNEQQNSGARSLDARSNHLLKQYRRRRKIHNGKFIHQQGKQEFNSRHPKYVNERHISENETPVQRAYTLLMQNDKVANGIQHLSSPNIAFQPKISQKGMQNPSRKFLETQIAKKSINLLEEVPSEDTKFSMNEQLKIEPCTNKLGCKQKSHLSKRENYADLRNGFVGNNYEVMPQPKDKDNIIIDVKDDTFKDTCDKNSTSLLQEIVEELHELRESGTVTQGLSCILFGHWKSQIGGMALNITGHNYTFENSTLQNSSQSISTHQNVIGPLVVDLYESTKLISTTKHPVLNGNWTLVGHVPHVVNGTLILNAENTLNKHVAVYIGQCRICEGAEIITGQWLIHYNVKDCRNMETSQMVRGDVFQRVELNSEEHKRG